MRSILIAVPLAALAAFALARGGPRPSHAGTAVELDVAGLIGASDLALEGRVQGVLGAFEHAGRIDTEYLLSVERTFWGEDLPTRALRLPGGELAGRGMAVPGLPRLVPGEHVVLMLSEELPGGARVPVGLAQGKYCVVTDPTTGRKLALRGQGGLALVSPGATTPHAADGVHVVDYAELLAEIEAAVVTRRAAEARER